MQLATADKVANLLQDNIVLVFSKSTCPCCSAIKDLLTELDVDFLALELDLMPDGPQIQAQLRKYAEKVAVPVVFVRGELVGGFSATRRALRDGLLQKKARLGDDDFDYDLVVIGGGSGGLAAAQEAVDLGGTVLLCDWVEPTPCGNRWGIGGTCLNVGCVPKKLMHFSAGLKTVFEDAPVFGWQIHGEVTNDWSKLVDRIQKFVKSVNFHYQTLLNKKGIRFVRSKASLMSKHKVKVNDGRDVVTAKYVLLATGLRPKYADLPNDRELCITSDDLFVMKNPPGKTIIIGASYVALECAGLLRGLGFDVTVMVRALCMRGFDQQMVGLVTTHLEDYGVTILRKCVPVSVERTSDDLRLVKADVAGEVREYEAQTVLLAIGRDANLDGLGLEEVGIAVKNNRIVVDDYDRTNVTNVFAVGDVALGRTALTPVAIHGGVSLARRLFGGSTDKTDYSYVPTTVFTPLQYGFVGVSEEAAVDKYGEDDVEVYHSHFHPLEKAMQVRDLNMCYAKLICVKSEDDAVVGLHVTGEGAGEIVQGFGLAMKMGAKLANFQSFIGVHPTSGEIFTKLFVAKSSGVSVEKTAC